jgi:2'-5' RNA ligase
MSLSPSHLRFDRSGASAPLILTLAMDERSFAFFEAQRRRHFPPGRNFIPAHLTLFHKLPGERQDAIIDDLVAVARTQARFPLHVSGVRSLGRGVAYTLRSPNLAELRQGLAARWKPWLAPQDRQKHQPHVTVQNKVDPEAARSLLAAIQVDFAPFVVTAEGLSLWRYLDGPWELLQTFAFPDDIA